MRHWPALLAQLQNEFPTLPDGGPPRPDGNYIRNGLADIRCAAGPVPPEGNAIVRELLVCGWGKGLLPGINRCNAMGHFFGEVENTLEEPIRDVLDHILFSIYRDGRSPWRRAPVVRSLAVGASSSPSGLVRRVAARFDYSTGEFEHFLRWANGENAGGLARWPEGFWLTGACCRWACHRLDAANPKSHQRYMTDILPGKYPWSQEIPVVPE